VRIRRSSLQAQRALADKRREGNTSSGYSRCDTLDEQGDMAAIGGPSAIEARVRVIHRRGPVTRHGE
jgi:hypothetical protein